MAQRDETPLSGKVQIDGCYTNGSVKPANRAADRVDRRLAEYRNPDRRCILVMRETFAKDALAERIGGKRTLTFVVPSENQADVGALAARFIAPGSEISADESDAYDLLHGCYPMRRVNHSREYRAADGTTQNQAESYISRFRRMQDRPAPPLRPGPPGQLRQRGGLPRGHMPLEQRRDLLRHPDQMPAYPAAPGLVR